MSILDKIGQMIRGDSKEGLPDLGSQGDQTPDEQEVVSFVKKRVTESRESQSRISHEGIWMTNTAYLLGFDGVYYDTKARQFKSSSQGTGSLKRNRLHVNKILPSAQNRLARLCKNPPKYDVRPKSNTPEDKDAARKALLVLNNVFEEQEVDRKRLSLYMWMQQCGHSYVKVSRDDQIGEPMIDPVTGEFSGYQGGTRLDVVSAFEVFPDPLAKNEDDLGWIAHAKVRKLDYFKRYSRGHLVKEEGAWLLSAQYEQRINSLNTTGPGQSNNQQVMKGAAIEIAYYERRSEKYPDGRMIITANGILLDDKELPVGEIPFRKFDDIVIGGKYYPESIITHVRPIQDQYNKTITMRANWVAKLLAGKYMAPKGHGLSQEALNDQSGELLEYNPGANGQKPEALQVPQIPSYAYEEEQKLEQQMYDIFGINEVSRGQIPAAGIPAIGMQFLMEQDDTRIGVVTESNELSWAGIAKLVLKYEAKFTKFKKTIKTRNKGSEYDFIDYTGEDIQGHDDVICIRGSTLPGSKVLKRQEILNLRQQGLLGNPQDPQVNEKTMEILEFGDSYQAWSQVAADSSQVARDIQMIRNGQMPPFNELDNHQYHAQKKNEFRIQEEYKLSPTSQAILNYDLNRHIDMISKMSNPMLGQMQSQIQQQQTDIQAAGMAHDQLQQNASLPPMAGPPPGSQPGIPGPMQAS